MNQWRLALQALDELGGVATTTQIKNSILFKGYALGPGHGPGVCRNMGLMTCARTGRHGNQVHTWTITEKGLDLLQNRIEIVPRPRGLSHVPGKTYAKFRPTWLISLPKGVRL